MPKKNNNLNQYVKELEEYKDRILKFLASFNNYEEACTMLCGKGRVRTQDLGYQAERYDHCTTRPV